MKTRKPLKRSPLKRKAKKHTRPVEIYELHHANGPMKIRGHYYADKHSPDGRRFVALNDWQFGLISNALAVSINLLCERSTPKETHYGCDPHHIYGRGAAKREDRIEVRGVRYLEWLCRDHHDQTPILRRRPVQ